MEGTLRLGQLIHLQNTLKATTRTVLFHNVFHTMSYANGGYKNQKCLLCGFNYTWNGDRQYYFDKELR